MTPDELQRLKELCEKGLADGSLMHRIPTWVTAGDGRQLLYEAVEAVPKLIAEVERLQIDFRSFVGMTEMNTQLKAQLAEAVEIIRSWSRVIDAFGSHPWNGQARAFLEKIK